MIAAEAPATNRVAELIMEAMTDQGMSVRDLSIKVDTTYENIRRITKGESIPSKFVLKAICDALKLNYKEAERLANADRMVKKFGTVPMELAGKNPELEPLERIWKWLDDNQKQDLIMMAQGWAKRNKVGK